MKHLYWFIAGIMLSVLAGGCMKKNPMEPYQDSETYMTSSSNGDSADTVSDLEDVQNTVTETNVETETETGTRNRINLETEILMDSGTNTETETVNDANFNVGTETETNSETETGKDTETDSGIHSGIETDTYAGTDSALDTGVDSDTSTEADTMDDIGMDSVNSTDTDGDYGTEVDTELPVDCTGLTDFMPCEVVTSPDRDFDICIKGVCQSPGCGSAACNVPGPYFPLADSGQRNCIDYAGPLDSCPALGDGYYGQDAQYGWDVTHERNVRYTRIVTAEEPIVRDNITGLVWQGCPAGLRGSACKTGTSKELNWGEAVEYCDALSWGGHDDWRLPDEFALQSIMDYGVSAPAVDLDAFPESDHITSWYWTSSTVASDESMANVLVSYYGHVCGSIKDDTLATRCVRGKASSNRLYRFERDDSAAIEPVVTDTVTGLTWQGCTSGRSGETCGTGAVWQMTWGEALDYCTDLSWGGQDDWRLPNIIELQSIVDNSRSDPSIDADIFPATDIGNLYWSSTSDTATANRIWCLYFHSGSLSDISMGSNLNVRCVRRQP